MATFLSIFNFLTRPRFVWIWRRKSLGEEIEPFQWQRRFSPSSPLTPPLPSVLFLANRN